MTLLFNPCFSNCICDNFGHVCCFFPCFALDPLQPIQSIFALCHYKCPTINESRACIFVMYSFMCLACFDLVVRCGPIQFMIHHIGAPLQLPTNSDIVLSKFVLSKFVRICWVLWEFVGICRKFQLFLNNFAIKHSIHHHSHILEGGGERDMHIYLSVCACCTSKKKKKTAPTCFNKSLSLRIYQVI